MEMYTNDFSIGRTFCFSKLWGSKEQFEVKTLVKVQEDITQNSIVCCPQDLK